MGGIVARFEERAAHDEVARRLWVDALAATGPVDGRLRARRRTVLANTLALAHFDADADVLDLQAIAGELGRRELADLQEELLAPVDGAAGRPLTTRLVRCLGKRAWGEVARTEGSLTHRSTEAREVCGETALRLLMVGDDGLPPVELGSKEALLRAFHGGDVVLWRRLVATAVDEPWSGYTDAQIALVEPELCPTEFESLRALAALAKKIAEEDERRAVADHIRATIASTGLTQRQFATLVGTSPSRLSTYATGSVTPSAAMLLRINRMAKRARASHGLTDEPA